MTFWKTKFTLYSFAFFLTTGGVLFLICASKAIRSIEILNGDKIEYASQIYDQNHMAIGSIYKNRRFYKKIEMLPNHVQLAFTSAEDKNFYQHFGVDVTAIMRALWQNLRHGSVQQGASTITQQVVKNNFLTPERTFIRKIKEVFLAWVLEYQLTKKQILEMYLNSVYFARNCYGLEAASLSFFGKHAEDLTLAEASLLAVSVRAPSALAPDRHFDRARKRQILLLSKMQEDGVISLREASAAINEKVSILSRRTSGRDGYFIDFALTEMSRKLARSDARSGSYQIVTSLNSSMQGRLTALLRDFAKKLTSYTKNIGDQLEGAFYAVDTKNATIVAMAGGLDYKRSQFNRVTQTFRQNAPLTYPMLAGFALDNGFDLLSNVSDDDHPMSLFEGLIMQDKKSFDYLALSLGQMKLANFSAEIGLPFSGPYGETRYSLGQIIDAYALLFQNARTADSILEITNKQEKALFRQPSVSRQAILSAKAQYLIRDVLQQNLLPLTKPAIRGVIGYQTITQGQKDIYVIVGIGSLVCGMWFGGERGHLRLGKSKSEASFLLKALQKQLYAVLAGYHTNEPAVDFFSRTKLVSRRYPGLSSYFVPFDPHREAF